MAEMTDEEIRERIVARIRIAEKNTRAARRHLNECGRVEGGLYKLLMDFNSIAQDAPIASPRGGEDPTPSPKGPTR